MHYLLAILVLTIGATGMWRGRPMTRRASSSWVSCSLRAR